MKIRELLSDESKWTKGVVARDKLGIALGPRNEKAVCWCLLGAAVRCYDYSPQYSEVIWKIRKALGLVKPLTSEWNDDPARTFAEVKALVEELDV